ncbi:hypothetical protein K2224_02185 [Streptomyces sp. BHT-5-2]|uniref:hypothetical protein n=1 Tax=unclassified Streptomyces TaxID=2593676 RepID=UPI001C8D9B84|nr:hypothetical protein [Streptomyces sp. BHT-5-2]QZL02171.1 hypothetical protein K2224_02185 [Streptomyces sp. BHT-5-2]
MSLSALRDMKFTALTDEEAAAASGEGKPRLSKLQCQAIYAQSLNPFACGGSMTDWYKTWKSNGCDYYGNPWG